MSNLRDYIEVHTKMFCGRVIISIKEKISSPDMTWRIKLKHNKTELYNQTDFSRQKTWIHKIDDAGCWLVFVEVKDKTRSFSPAHIRESFWVYSKKQKQDYRAFLSEYSDAREINQLPLAELRKPYQNMAVVYYARNQISSKKLEDCKEKIDPLLHIYTKDISESHNVSVISQGGVPRLVRTLYSFPEKQSIITN